jgi:hypothetical protein
VPSQRVGTLAGTGPKLPWQFAKAFSCRDMIDTRAREVMRAELSPELRRTIPLTAMVRLGMAAATATEAAAARRRKGLGAGAALADGPFGKEPARLRGNALRNLAANSVTEFPGAELGYSVGMYTPILPRGGYVILLYPKVVVSLYPYRLPNGQG